MQLSSVKDLIALNDGNKIPAVGFGTWQIFDNQNGKEPVLQALECGYRHIDTAALYNSEESVGLAVKESGLKREEVFITTKVWKDDLVDDAIKASLYRSLDNLKMDYVDLFLIHWPRANYNDLYWPFILAKAWEKMLSLKEEGLYKSIGVANFLPHHLQALPDWIKPACDQIEFHVGYMQEETLEYCQKRGILVEGWAALGRGLCLNNPQIEAIAKKHQVTTAQVCLRFCLELGVVPLVKSANPQRMSENTKLFDFSLDEEDLKALKVVPNKSGWSGEHPDTAIPFCDEERHFL